MNYKDLKKEIKNNIKKLNKEDRKEFIYVMYKIKFSIIDEKDKYEFLQQLLDSLLIAEKAGKSIKEVLGTDDIQSYCNMILKEYADEIPKLVKITRIALNYIFIILTLLISSLVGDYISQTMTLPNYNGWFSFSLSMLVTYILIILIIMLEKKSFYAVRKIKAGEFVSIIVFLLFLVFVEQILLSGGISGVVLFSLNSISLIIVSVISLLAAYVVSKILDR